MRELRARYALRLFAAPLVAMAATYVVCKEAADYLGVLPPWAAAVFIVCSLPMLFAGSVGMFEPPRYEHWLVDASRPVSPGRRREGAVVWGLGFGMMAFGFGAFSLGAEIVRAFQG